LVIINCKAAEEGVNAQINSELQASYIYQSMASHFDRDDIALPGFRDFFQKSSTEERGHAQKFIDYQNKRGGRVVLKPLEAPPQEWSPLSALEAALALEKIVNEKLLKLHKVAGDNIDPHLCDFIEEEFLEEQVEAEKELADKITNLKRCGEGLGVFLFDKELK